MTLEKAFHLTESHFFFHLEIERVGLGSSKSYDPMATLNFKVVVCNMGIIMLVLSTSQGYRQRKCFVNPKCHGRIKMINSVTITVAQCLKPAKR